MKYQANILKIMAVAVAIPRYAGAFALSVGFIAEGNLHNIVGLAEIIAGVSMAVLEGFALAFILNKWRLLKPKSAGWSSLLAVVLLLAVSLPLVAMPYLYFMQTDFKAASDLFDNIWLQNGWNFIVAGVPMLVVIGVGLADVNELEREQRQIDFELETSKKQAYLEMEKNKLELEVEQAKAANELEIRRLRATYKVEVSQIEAKVKRGLTREHVCEFCGEAFEREPQLRGHKGQCRARANSKLGIENE